MNQLKTNNDNINNSLKSLCKNAAQKKSLKKGSKIMFAATLACLKQLDRISVSQCRDTILESLKKFQELLKEESEMMIQRPSHVTIDLRQKNEAKGVKKLEV